MGFGNADGQVRRRDRKWPSGHSPICIFSFVSPRRSESGRTWRRFGLCRCGQPYCEMGTGEIGGGSGESESLFNETNDEEGRGRRKGKEYTMGQWSIEMNKYNKIKAVNEVDTNKRSGSPRPSCPSHMSIQMTGGAWSWK